MDNSLKSAAYKFVILVGIVSLFADMAYEGARSINGPYLQQLGASATTVGFIAGFGELIGYALRLVSGMIADITGKYWTVAIIGYLFNLIPVPLLAITGHIEIAAVLIILERFGKALRTPPRDAMLSHAGKQVGLGWAFGLHEALDRAGAMIGPLVIALLLYKKFSYQFAYCILVLPVIGSLMTLLIAHHLFPYPRAMEPIKTDLVTAGIAKTFWIYLLGAIFLAIGFADFALMSYHFSKTGLFSAALIPLSYAFAMGVSAITAPLFGYLYDRIGFIIIIIIAIITLAFAPLVFLGNKVEAFLGVIVWSLGFGANDSLMRAVIAQMAPVNRRASAYGFFNLGYGVAWFLGSVAMGYLYDYKIMALVVFSVAAQVCALPFLFIVMRKMSNRK